MQAICGMFGRPAADSAAAEDLPKMLDALRIRAAGEPIMFAPGATVRFGMRGEAGYRHSPCASPDGRYHAVADGEVFNRGELAQRFGVPQSAAADSTELLMRVFAAGGPAGLKEVDGQFALAVWDRLLDKLFLVRDFLGVLPLYYARLPQGLVFASQIRGLLQHPRVGRSYDLEAVSNYLTFLNAAGPATLFEGVHRLLPGHVATVDSFGGVELERYWDLLDAPIAEKEDAGFYVDRVRMLHEDAVRRRALGGHVGALLSGGNDSSANVALLARHQTAPLHTFTIGLEDVEGSPAYTDLEYARRVSRHVGTTHHELLMTTDQFLESIPEVTGLLDDAVSEPSSVFLYQALKLARDSGVHTLITGEANDELCCGHGEMISIRNGYYRRWVPYMRWPRAVRRILGAAAPYLFKQRADILGRAARDEEYFCSFEIGWPDSAKGSVLSRAALAELAGHRSGGIAMRCKERFNRSGHAQRDYLNYIVYAMMQDFYFGNLMLGKLDLLSRGMGVDARCPYTSPDYAHFVYNIPAALKMRDGTVKWFFKKAIEGLLPDEIIYRPKQGFRTPVVEMFRGRLAEWARPHLLEGGFTAAGVVERRRIESLLSEHRAGHADHSNKLWTLMALNLWHERWLGSNGGRHDG